VQSADPGKRRLEMVGKMAKAGMQPFCWALRLHPRADGFTLFAHAENKDHLRIRTHRAGDSDSADEKHGDD
jgi:hypothetical protein